MSLKVPCCVFMFTFSVSHQNTLCVFLKLNKQVEYISVFKKYFHRQYFKSGILNLLCPGDSCAKWQEARGQSIKKMLIMFISIYSKWIACFQPLDICCPLIFAKRQFQSQVFAGAFLRFEGIQSLARTYVRLHSILISKLYYNAFLCTLTLYLNSTYKEIPTVNQFIFTVN